MFNIKGFYSRSVFNILCRQIVKRSKTNMVILGLLIGLSPCGPLLSILTYIAGMMENPLYGLIAGFLFGLATSLIALIPLGVAAGFAIDKIKNRWLLILMVRILSAVILIYFGIQLVIRR